MDKYAKIIDDKTGLCNVGTGPNTDFYESIGMQLMQVQQSDIDGSWYLSDKCPMKTDEQKTQEERQRLDSLSLTKREVFLALYKAKRITPETLKSQITDPEALIEFEYANEYFRGNPLINLIGQSLGFTSDELDYLFENKELPESRAENAQDNDKSRAQNADDESKSRAQNVTDAEDKEESENA